MSGFKSPEGIHIQRVAETLSCPMCNPSRGCGAAASPTATDRKPLTGFGGCGRERPRATEMEALTGLGGIRKRTRCLLAEIDTDIRYVEEALRNGLSFRGLLRP